LQDYVVKRTKSERALPSVSSAMPFDLSKHPFARSHISRGILARFRDDVTTYATQENNGNETHLKCLLPEEFDRAMADKAGATSFLQRVSEHLKGLDQALKATMSSYFTNTANHMINHE
jgi:hypothetical protein